MESEQETTNIVGQALPNAALARVNVTFAGGNGDLIDPVPIDSSDVEVRAWVTESLRTGGIAGIAASPDANIDDFVVDRFAATDARPYALLQVRPKTPFGIA